MRAERKKERKMRSYKDQRNVSAWFFCVRSFVCTYVEVEMQKIWIGKELATR